MKLYEERDYEEQVTHDLLRELLEFPEEPNNKFAENDSLDTLREKYLSDQRFRLNRFKRGTQLQRELAKVTAENVALLERCYIDQ